MSPLFHLIYISKATSHCTDASLTDILTISQKNNKLNNITGFLIFREGMFIQLLEGEETTVLRTLEKIKQDKRHRNLKILGQAYSSLRIMPDWSMTLLRTEKAAPSIGDILNLIETGTAGTQTELKSTIELMLKKFSYGTEKV